MNCDRKYAQSSCHVTIPYPLKITNLQKVYNSLPPSILFKYIEIFSVLLHEIITRVYKTLIIVITVYLKNRYEVIR